jgi:hypothetical protein
MAVHNKLDITLKEPVAATFRASFQRYPEGLRRKKKLSRVSLTCPRTEQGNFRIKITRNKTGLAYLKI